MAPKQAVNAGEIAALNAMTARQQGAAARIFGRTAEPVPGLAPIEVSQHPEHSPEPPQRTSDGWVEHTIEDGAGLIFPNVKRGT